MKEKLKVNSNAENSNSFFWQFIAFLASQIALQTLSSLTPRWRGSCLRKYPGFISNSSTISQWSLQHASCFQILSFLPINWVSFIANSPEHCNCVWQMRAVLYMNTSWAVFLDGSQEIIDIKSLRCEEQGTLLLRVCALLHNPKADGKVLNTNWSMLPTRLLVDVNYFQGWEYFQLLMTCPKSRCCILNSSCFD